MSRQHDKLFSDLLGFIQGAHKQLEILHENDIAGRKNGDPTAMTFLPARLEIPTAALIAGEGGWGVNRREDEGAGVNCVEGLV